MGLSRLLHLAARERRRAESPAFRFSQTHTSPLDFLAKKCADEYTS